MSARNDLTVSAGGTTIKVTGLKDTLRALTAAGAEADDLRALMTTLAGIVATSAQPPARRQSGTMAGTIRPANQKQRAVIRAGSAAAPYTAVQHYGWPGHNISPNPFLTDAIARTTPQILAAFDQGISQLLKRHNL